ncbi:hypothetical protein BD779DRAFT_888982 [Infundibulicybe gibba]|nr:hypothetical protein BD779DRAFT_888982 [Infundibulicybe gibba]
MYYLRIRDNFHILNPHRPPYPVCERSPSCQDDRTRSRSCAISCSNSSVRTLGPPPVFATVPQRVVHEVLWLQQPVGGTTRIAAEDDMILFSAPATTASGEQNHKPRYAEGHHCDLAYTLHKLLSRSLASPQNGSSRGAGSGPTSFAFTAPKARSCCAFVFHLILRAGLGRLAIALGRVDGVHM